MRRIELNDESLIAQVGRMPVPPYIHTMLEDPERYQTVYAGHGQGKEGSAAAPTAGLHFTHDLMGRLEGMGVELAYVTLHIGLDTFRPVEVEDVAAHTLHTEYWELPPETAEAVNLARHEGRRVVAVGTTSVRVLEQSALLAEDQGSDAVRQGSGWAELFILPGHGFKVVDAMITNFHLPRSTLLMMVSAFAGRERVLAAYEEAVRNRYRFYSFGDAMLIV
jgi:S-adenosylmethionine:tRNA ribosyltransferase-isomerase